MADTSRPGSRIGRIEEIYCQARKQREDEGPAFLNPLIARGFWNLKRRHKKMFDKVAKSVYKSIKLIKLIYLFRERESNGKDSEHGLGTD